MKRLSMVIATACLLAVAGGCSPDSDSSNAADEAFSLTGDEVWHQYPIGAEWTLPMLGDGESVLTTRSDDPKYEVCDGSSLDLPSGVDRVGSGLLGSRTRSVLTDTFVFSEPAQAASFQASLVDAAGSCDLWTPMTEELKPDYILDSDERAVQRARWTGEQFAIADTSSRAGIAFRIRGNVVVAVYAAARGIDETAEQDAHARLGGSVAILLNALDGLPTEMPTQPADVIDPNAVCRALSVETIARLLDPEDYATRAISDEFASIDCRFSSADPTTVLTLSALKTVAPSAPEGPFSSGAGAGATKAGATVLAGLTPDPGLSEADWSTVADELYANL